METLAKIIGAKKELLPTYGYSKDFAYPHIEVDGSDYHCVINERGREQERRSTPNFEELIYWIFDSVTSHMAFEYELKNRIEDRDVRRMAFPKQMELMNKLGPELGENSRLMIEEILKRAPYDDEPIKRVCTPHKT